MLLGDRIEQAIHKATRGRGAFAVLFMDLDGFKAVNDVFGHHAGDLLLREVARRIQDGARDEDTVARLGGDEFVMVMDVTRPEEAAEVAQRLVEELGAPYVIHGTSMHVSVSIGIALFPENGLVEHDLLVNADAAMYHAKEQGRNGYRFFESAMNANVHLQLMLQQDLRRAIDRKEFVLHYQPKMISPEGPMVGVEALLRWSRPGHGMVAPDGFLPIAERTGLIVPIGNWVIDEACRQMRAWLDEGHATWTVAVNLSRCSSPIRGSSRWCARRSNTMGSKAVTSCWK